MKMWNVIVGYAAVVVAKDAFEARDVAQREAREITWDASDPEVSVEGEIKLASDLRNGWDVRCIPYGVENDETIGELNPSLYTKADQ